MLTVYCDENITAHNILIYTGIINSWVTFAVCMTDFSHAGRISVRDFVHQEQKVFNGHPFHHLKWDGEMVVRSDRVKDATFSCPNGAFSGWNMPGYAILGQDNSTWVVQAIIDVDKNFSMSLPDITIVDGYFRYDCTEIKLLFEIMPNGSRRIGYQYVMDYYFYGRHYHYNLQTIWWQQFPTRDSCFNAGIKLGPVSLSQQLPKGVVLTCSQQEMANIVESAFEPYLPTWDLGDLCQICADGSKAIDINTIMFMKEWMEIGEMVKSTLDLFKGKPNPKKLAGAYLSYTYGYKLSYADTVELYNVCKSEASKIRRESATSRARKSCVIQGYHNVPITFTGTAGMNYSPYPYLEGQIINDLFRWDVFPTFSNLYDWVPWSFVIDWFYPIGPALDAIDYRTYIQTLTINFMCYGRKWVIDSIPNYDRYLYLPWWGRYLQPISALKCSYYHRWYERQATPPKIESEFPTSFNHWVEGSALLIQKVSK